MTRIICYLRGYKFVIARSSATKQSHLRLHGQHSMNKYHVYIMTNSTNTVLYTGVTGDIAKRVFIHKNKLADGFTKKYNVTKLVYSEEYSLIEDAIKREKQIKGGSRKKKIELIKTVNPEFKELKVVG
jgi:putative endonuclease